MNDQTFFEEQKKRLVQYNLKKRKLVESKKYSIPQPKLPSKNEDVIDKTLLLE